MHVTRENPTPTTTKLTISAEPEIMRREHEIVIKRLGKGVKVPGFRAGKAPDHLIAKQLDTNALQSEFLEQMVNKLYTEAVGQERLRPVSQPQVSIVKFVPFTTLEINIEVETVGPVKLANYRNLKARRVSPKVTSTDCDEVIKTIRERSAVKEEVSRAAKIGDETIIDFEGSEPKTNQPVAGAKGDDHPLILGSNSFIPGFEENLIGLKVKDSKEFDIVFPKDYGSKNLQNKKVKFKVTVKKINKITLPKLDDSFASTAGPFKTLTELKSDIKKQLLAEKAQQADRDYENALLEELAAKSTVALPETLIDQEIERIEEEEKRNLVYRGQTWQEHLESEGISEKEHREKNRSGAELRIKAGLVLAEIAEHEGVIVSPQELDIRLQLLQGQYSSDAKMLSELQKPENKRDILSRLLTEKTLEKLISIQTNSSD